MATKKKAPGIDPAFPLRGALDAAGARPADGASRTDKKNYAEKLSRQLAELVAEGLRKPFPKITPSREGKGHEVATSAAGGKKRLDVRVWKEPDGLILSISIKTYSFADWIEKTKTTGRYVKNILRNDHELRAEADVVHRRQPYAVLIALVFLNAKAARDASKDGHSSFVHAVRTFRKRAGRRGPDDTRYDRFERVYIGLYETEGEERGRVWFFDVLDKPPKNGIPRKTCTFEEMLEQIRDSVADRNEELIEYEDGAELTVEEVLDEPEGDDDPDETDDDDA